MSKNQNNRILEIPLQDLWDSLEDGYKEYRDCLAAGHDQEDLAHIKGYCTTIEQILNLYGGITSEEMLKIKRPIIGEVSLRRKRTIKQNQDYEIPTIWRKK